MINVYGCGFVGGEYAKKYPVEINLREEFEPKTNDILYFVSTIDNYNVLDNPLIDIETNLVYLMKVLDASKKKYGNEFTFNFISSWFVYGSCDLPAKESAICSPKGFYSITKKAAEDLLISYCETFNIRYRIIRLCNVLGKTDNKVSKKKNALQYILNCLKDGEQVNLYNNGEFYRDYMHVEDVVDAINLIVSKSEPDQIYNVGSGRKVEFKDIIKYAKNKLNSTSVVNNIPPANFHTKVQTKDMLLDVEKLNSLGFVPRYKSMESIIDNLVE